LQADKRFADVIDAVVFEGTWFAGKGDVSWDSPDGGDLANSAHGELSTAARLKQYVRFLESGKPVFTLDYCLRPQNARIVYKEARDHGLVPLVTRSSLGGMTLTPPLSD